MASVATGTDKTLVTLFNPAATPTCRGRIFGVEIGSVTAPADQAADFLINRITALGTEGSGLVPNNLDPAGPAGAYDSGLGVFSVEPTYTAAKQLLACQVNQRAAYRWAASGHGYELMMAATQNNGAGLKSVTSTSTQAHGVTLFFAE